MTTWADLYRLNGYYESDVYDVSSDFDTYIPFLQAQYQNNDGEIRIYISFSFDDGKSWENWIDVTDGYESFSYLVDLNHVLFKYRITFRGNVAKESPVFNSFRFDLRGVLFIDNLGDLPCYPEIWIKKLNNDGAAELRNESTGQVMIIDEMVEGETIYIDCENEDLLTDLPLTYRYDNFNNVYMRFDTGENWISGKGDIEVSFRYQFKFLQG